MPVEYVFEESISLVRAWASGTVTAREVIDAIDQAVGRYGGVVLHRKVLTLLAEGTSLDQFDAAALKRIHAHIESWMRIYPGGDVKSAFVTADPGNTGLLKLWSALVDMYPTVGRHVQIFRTQADALAWLNDAG